MSNITSSTLAAANAVSIQNKQFKPSGRVLPRKILIVGTGDPATEAGNSLNTPILATSAAEIASKIGFGFMLHRLALQNFLGSNGIETYFIQQAENVAAVQAAGELSFAGSVGVLAGTLAVYIAGIRVPVTITAAMTIENIADAVVSAINTESNLPVIAAKVLVTFEVTITAKSGGPWGNDITLDFNLLSTDVTPTGVVPAVSVPMAGGAGLPDIQDALDSLGTGDGANEDYFTALIHGYGQDTTTLDAIANYVGQGNDPIGLYDPLVHKPFRSLVGDTVAGSAGLTALLVIGGNRKEDRASGIIPAPDSPNHPAEIAALTMGIMERLNNELPAKSYKDVLLPGILPGDKADRWTSEHTNRDIAKKAGICSTIIKSGAVYLQDVVTFYHPDSVPVESNIYRQMSHISITQNVLYNWFLNFESDRWKGKSIVSDVTRVSDITARQNVVDIDTYRADAVALILFFESVGWTYESDYSISNLQVAVRSGNNGFDSITKLIYSGVSDITNSKIEGDTSIASLL